MIASSSLRFSLLLFAFTLFSLSFLSSSSSSFSSLVSVSAQAPPAGSGADFYPPCGTGPVKPNGIISYPGCVDYKFFPIFNVTRTAPQKLHWYFPEYTFPNSSDQARYQIILWTAILLAFILLTTVYSMITMEFKKDTMLYSSFNPNWEDRKRR